jgi:aminopeptidase N
MPGTNLTRAEAAERARLLTVAGYDVSLDLTTSDTQFGSTTVITFGCSEPGAATFADLVDAEVKAITLNGKAIELSAYADSRITLEDLQADNVLEVNAICAFTHTGEGLHRFVDPADKLVYLYSQFEVPDARRVFTTFEQPDLKASFTFHVTAPAHWNVVSNAPTPDPVPVDASRAVWDFPPTKRISTYVTAVVAGEYVSIHDRYEGSRGSIDLGIYVRESLRQYIDTEEIFLETKQGFAFFEDAFDMAYPFEKYDQLFVPEYNMGAMENAGCVTLRDEYVFRSRQTMAAYESRCNTILHEMAHMWFGDLVTMKWWDDLWLNESFAEWASHHAAVNATRFTDAWTGFTNLRKNWAYRQDQLPTTHPIAADNHDLHAVEVNFDGITYAKGAAALRQLVAWVGEEEFLAGLQRYFARHRYGNSELKDLLGALEETSGRDLQAWSDEWLKTSGVNTMRAVSEVDGKGAYASLAIEQAAHPDFPTLRRHRIGIGLYDLSEGRLIRRMTTEVDVEGPRTEIAKLTGQPVPDLLLINDGDLTYTKIRLDEGSLATIVESIDKIDDSLARALCWGAAWDMLRDAEMAATDYVRLVLRGVGTESDLTAVGALLRQAQSATTYYAAPANRAALSGRWQDGLFALMAGADGGSDHQLALVRAYANAADSDDALEFVRDLLDGAVQREGLKIDTDLRWTLLGALARNGRIDTDEVDNELARDDTIAGREHAAAVLAMIPTAEAKARAWTDAVVRDDVPNETQRSIAIAFYQRGQDEVLAPYRDRYLQMASTIWDDRGVQRASTALSYLFPRIPSSAETLAAVDHWLETTGANLAAKRLVSEGRADMIRHLNGQARDAQSALASS